MSVNAGQIYQNNLQRKSMTERIDSLSEEIFVLSQEAMREQEKRDNAQRETVLLREEYLQLDEKIKGIISVVSAVEHTIFERMEEIDRLNVVIDNLRGEKQISERDYQGLLRRNNDLNVIIEGKEAYIDRLKGTEQSYLEKVRHVQKEYNALNELLISTEERIQKMEKDIASGYSYVESQRKEMEDQKSALGKYKVTLNIYASRLNKEFERLGLSGTITSL